MGFPLRAQVGGSGIESLVDGVNGLAGVGVRIVDDLIFEHLLMRDVGGALLRHYIRQHVYEVGIFHAAFRDTVAFVIARLRSTEKFREGTLVALRMSADDTAGRKL